MFKFFSRIFQSGEYRIYFHIGPIGIKIAKPSKPNYLASFFAACAMNSLERKRYLYYTKMKPMRQWNSIWKADYPLALNPTYFSCGIFNIVQHCKTTGFGDRNFQVMYRGEWMDSHDPRLPKTAMNYRDMGDDIFDGFVEVRSSNEGNVCIRDGKLYALDYGDFEINRANNRRVTNIDYA